MRASVWASSVLPQPVGPISRMFDLASSTSLAFAAVAQALVVVVHRDRRARAWRGPGRSRSRRGPGGSRLGVGTPSLGLHQGGLVLLPDDVHAEFDAFIADEHGRAGDELPDLVLALAAEASSRGCCGSRPRTWRLAFLNAPPLGEPADLRARTQDYVKLDRPDRHNLKIWCVERPNRETIGRNCPELLRRQPPGWSESGASPAPRRSGRTPWPPAGEKNLSRSIARSISSIVLAGVGDVHLVQPCPGRQDLAGMDLDVRRLALGAARGLVDHDAGVGQGEALALLARPSAAASRPTPPGRYTRVEICGRMYCMVS